MLSVTVSPFGVFSNRYKYVLKLHYEKIMHKALLAVHLVYGIEDHHDAVLYFTHGSEHVGIIYAQLVHYAEQKSQKLVLVRILPLIHPDLGKSSVVNNFGHL